MQNQQHLVSKKNIGIKPGAARSFRVILRQVVGVDDTFWRGKFPTIPYLGNKTMFQVGIHSLFGDDIPAAAVEKLRKDLEEGTCRPPNYDFRDDLYKDIYGYYHDGTITLSSVLIREALDSSEKRWYLFLVMLEEFGHHLDHLLRNYYSSVGRDAIGDEGTRFTADFLWYNHLLFEDFRYATFQFGKILEGTVKVERSVNYEVNESEVDREKRAKYLFYVEDKLADQGVVSMKNGSTVTVEFYKIRGNGAVHEAITRSAANQVGFEYTDSLDEGCAWPDVPCSANPNSVETCYYRTWQDYKTPGTLAYRSHYGDLQYWHSMAPIGVHTNQRILDKIIHQARLWYEMALAENEIFHVGKILHMIQDSYSRSHVVRVEVDEAPKPPERITSVKIIHVNDGDTLDSIADHYKLTWQELAEYNWGTGDPELINIHLRDSVGCTTKIGSNYIFETANKPGLIKIPIETEREVPVKKKNQILYFQSYTDQDEHKHGEADKADGSWDTAIGALDARDASTRILRYYKERTPYLEVEKFLRDVVYPFAPGAGVKLAGGSDEEYEK